LQQLLVNAEDTMLQIHIVPAEPEDLSAPQAVDEQQDKCQVQPVSPRGLQEGADLSRRPRLLADRAIGRQRGEPVLKFDQPGMPGADRRLGREPVWRPATIRSWHSQRSRQTHSDTDTAH
jgi:hypothetical protein